MENKDRCTSKKKKAQKMHKIKRYLSKYYSKKGSSDYQTLVQYPNFWNLCCGKQQSTMDPNVV